MKFNWAYFLKFGFLLQLLFIFYRSQLNSCSTLSQRQLQIHFVCYTGKTFIIIYKKDKKRKNNTGKQHQQYLYNLHMNNNRYKYNMLSDKYKISVNSKKNAVM